MSDNNENKKRRWSEDYDDGLIEGIHFPESADEKDEAYEARRAERRERREAERSGRLVVKAILREIKEDLILLAVTVGIVLLLNTFVIINARIPSASMENTIMEGDRLFGYRLAYLFDEPERYDIVIFKYPDDKDTLFVKRVIGLPGERVTISEGKVYINEETVPLDDDFCPEVPTGTYGPYEVPEGAYFVMGDNRQHSNDSRFWENSYVVSEDIVGKVGLRYWPIGDFGLVG